MKSTLHVCSALLAVVLYVLLTARVGDSQHVPVRCLCTKARTSVKQPLSGFEVHLKRPGCSRVEIIVTLKKTGKPLCLSPDQPQGKGLLKCWQRRSQKTKGHMKKCLKRQKTQKKQTRSKKTAS